MKTEKDYEKIEVEGLKILVDNDKLVIAYYEGRKKSPQYKAFRDEDDMQVYINYLIKSVEEKKQAKKARNEEKKKEKEKIANDLQVGDILVGSWGYDQTNVDAFQIVKKPSKFRIECKAVHLETVKGSENFMSDRVKPVKNSFSSNHIHKFSITGKYIKYLSSCYLSKWDGKSDFYRSWYA